jgi:hypothetical protein
MHRNGRSIPQPPKTFRKDHPPAKYCVKVGPQIGLKVAIGYRTAINKNGGLAL